MLWIILYIVIGIGVALWVRDDLTEGVELVWIGVFWPLLVLLFAFMFFLDAIGFRIH